MLHPTILDPASGRTAHPPAVRPLVPVSTDPFELLRVIGAERRSPHFDDSGYDSEDDSELGRRRHRRLVERCSAGSCTGDKPA
jgi:hypothetical protein